MSNVLPPEARARIRSEYRARFLLASLCLIVVGASVIFALLPAAVSLAAVPIPSAPATATVSDTATDLVAIKHTQGIVAALASSTAATSSISALESLLAARGSGITINLITYSAAAHTITLNGSAASPADITAFQDALQQNPIFTNVSVPVGELFDAQGGAFTMTVSGTF